MSPKYLTKYNKFRVSNLFLETANRDILYDSDSDRAMPIFTLTSEDLTDSLGNKYISMHKLFLIAGDVTGYKFAVDVLGSYEHLEKLLVHKVIGPHIEAWKRELKAKLDSNAMEMLATIAKDGGTQAQLSAAKYLVNREYEQAGNVGKPSTKNTTKKQETHNRITSAETKEEAERLGLVTH